MSFDLVSPACAHQLGRVRHYAGVWALCGASLILVARVFGASAETRMPDLVDAVAGAAYSPVALSAALAVPVGVTAAKMVPYVGLDILSRRYGLSWAEKARRGFRPSVERSISDMADAFYCALTLMISVYLSLWTFVQLPGLLVMAGTCAAFLAVMTVAFSYDPSERTALPTP